MRCLLLVTGPVGQRHSCLLWHESVCQFHARLPSWQHLLSFEFMSIRTVVPTFSRLTAIYMISRTPMNSWLLQASSFDCEGILLSVHGSDPHAVPYPDEATMSYRGKLRLKHPVTNSLARGREIRVDWGEESAGQRTKKQVTHFFQYVSTADSHYACLE
jgi:hypothetical protein